MTDTDTRDALHPDTIGARLLAADQRATRLARTLDPVTVETVVRAINAAADRHAGTHVDAVEVEAVALADALAQMAGRPGVSIADARRVAAGCVLDALRDCTARRAGDALVVSLDASLVADDPNGVTLADTVAISASGSHMGESTGGYRGVARVPHPTDILRPLAMPTPAERMAAAWDALNESGQRVLRVTLAAAVADEQQTRENLAEARRLVRAIGRDVRALARASRRVTHAQARTTLRAAQKHAQTCKEAADEYRPRANAAAVAAALGASKGRASQRVAQEQQSAARVALATIDAVQRAALAEHADRLTALAERQRSAFLAAPGSRALAARLLAPAKRLGRETTTDAVYRVARARRAHPTPPREWRTVVARGTRAAQRVTGNALGHTLACPLDGLNARPVRALAGWHGAHPLPGSPKSLRADVKAAQGPERSRTHADAARTDRGAFTPAAARVTHCTDEHGVMHAEPTCPACTAVRRSIERTRTGGLAGIPAAPTPAREAVAAPTLGAEFEAACDRRRAIVAAVRSLTGTRAAWRVAFSATA